MKRIIYLLLLSLLSLTAMAQELTVKSFELTSSLDGKKYVRLDANDDPCALIKVQLARQGAVFEGNVVGQVDYKTSEYWVYMYTGSTKMLTVKVDGVLPLKVYFPDYGIDRLQPNNTYSLVLTLPSTGRQEVNLGADFFVLMVEPANADVKVEIDGSPKSRKSDGSFMATLEPGEHRYNISATGYLPISKTFRMGNTKMTETVNLTADQCELTVSCKTTEAQIYVDNELRGKGNWKGKLPSGDYIVEARLDGHRAVRKLVKLANQKPASCPIEALEPILGGLSVSYSPANAEIWVDGKHLDNTPAKMRLTEGNHKIEIRKDGYQTFSQQVNIREGKVSTLEGELSKAASPAVTANASDLTDIFNGHAYVDLGLTDVQGRTIYWATCNVGAENPEDAGLYFAWGETIGYGSNPNDGHKFDWKNYKWAKSSGKKMTKYCHKTKDGVYDGKFDLDREDDAASVNWGGGWRTPPLKYMQELVWYCDWTWDSTKNGYKVTGRNGNSIFLPATGFRNESELGYVGQEGLYWTTSIAPMTSFCAWRLIFDSNSINVKDGDRFIGRPIRAICISPE